MTPSNGSAIEVLIRAAKRIVGIVMTISARRMMLLSTVLPEKALMLPSVTPMMRVRRGTRIDINTAVRIACSKRLK